jgi:hypothetical protein
MKTGNVPQGKLVDQTGYITNEWYSFISNLTTQMRLSLGDEGYTFPSQSSDDIDTLSNDQSKARIINDSDTNQLKMNNNGVYTPIAGTYYDTQANIDALDLSKYESVILHTTDTDTTYLVVNGVKKTL